MQPRKPKSPIQPIVSHAQQALMQALKKNDQQAVENMIKNKEKLQLDLATKVDGAYPLTLAIMNMNTKLVRLLLQHGAPLSGLLFFTAISKNVPADLLEAMLEHMAASHQSITHYAGAMNGLDKLLQRVPESKRENVTQLFKQYGINIESANSVCHDFTPLHAAVLLQRPAEIIEMLLRYDANNHRCHIKAIDIAKAMENEALTNLLEGEEIPNGQSWIISAVETVMPNEAAAYGEIGGLCYALALKHGEAFLLNQHHEFNKQFKDIANIDVNTLNSYMNKTECEVLSYEMRRSSLAAKMSLLKDKQDSASIHQLAKFTEDMDYLNEFKKASEKTLALNTLIKDTFKITLKPQLNHSTEKNHLSTVGWDKKSLAHGGIRVGHCCTGMYTIKELTIHLKALAHFAEQIDYPFSVHLDNWGHAVNLCYDKKTKQFIFFDANKMPAKTSSDPEMVSKWIMTAIIPPVNGTPHISVTANDTLCLQSRFLVTGDNIQRFKNDIQKELFTQVDWQTVHKPTTDKVTSLDSVGHSWLLVSVQQKENVEEMKALIAAGANPNLAYARDYDYNSTPLFFAVEYQNIDVVEALLNAKPEGANPNQKTVKGISPLYMAVQKKNIAIVDALLNANPHGADPNQINATGISPLCLAIELGDIAIVKLLLNQIKNTKQEIANVAQITKAATDSDDFDLTMLVINQLNDEADARRQREKEEAEKARRQLIPVSLSEDKRKTTRREGIYQSVRDDQHIGMEIPTEKPLETSVTTRREGIFKPRKGNETTGVVIPEHMPETAQPNKRREGVFKLREDNQATGVVIPAEKPEAKKPSRRLELSDDAHRSAKEKRRKETSTSEPLTIPTEKAKRKPDVQHREFDLDVDAKQKLKQQKKAEKVTDAKTIAPAKKKDIKPGTLRKNSVFGAAPKKKSVETSKPVVASKKTEMSKKS